MTASDDEPLPDGIVVPDDAAALAPLDRLDDATLRRELDEAGATEAAGARTRERWLRQRAVESARLSGVLRTAAELEAEVVVRTTAGNSRRGRVAVLGTGICGLVTTDGSEVFVRLDAITTVRLDRTLLAPDAADDRPATDDLLLGEVLAQEVGHAPSVALICAGDPEPVVGRLRSVGEDVAVVEPPHARRELVYVALASLTEVVFLASG